jgi:CheY-like chemotaxis protein
MNHHVPPALRGWDVVIVDDEEDSLEVAEILLLELGATVHTATNGKDGVALIRQVRPRLVISDLSMPIMDGWGLIFEMRKDPDLRDIPALALTAHAMQGDRERTLAAGFQDYLTKPIEAKPFIRDLLERLAAVPHLQAALQL